MIDAPYGHSQKSGAGKVGETPSQKKGKKSAARALARSGKSDGADSGTGRDSGEMVSPERQRDIMATTPQFCSDAADMTDVRHPEVADSVTEVTLLLPRECPAGPATWQLASCNWGSNAGAGLS